MGNMPTEIEKALYETREFLLSVIGESPFGILGIDLKGKIMVVNHKLIEILGKNLDVDQLIGQDIKKIIEGIPELVKVINTCLKRGRKSFDLRSVKIMGKKKKVFLTIKGRMITAGMLIVVEDVTVEAVAAAAENALKRQKEIVRRKLAAAEALMAEKLAREEKLATIGKLSGIMAHEIRNPLGVIRNSIYFINLKLKENMDEKVKKHIHILETEINSCDKIISDVLEFARTKPPSFTEAEINSVVQGVLSKASIPETIKVQTDLGENLPKLVIDIAQIKQVFLNLISNAIEAMPEGGELRVTTSQTDSFISIALKDTGVGIPKENFDKLFTPLFSTKTKGLGLGLAACQNIITAHQGTIEFESPARQSPDGSSRMAGGKEGQGTTFTIKLPIAQKVDAGQEN